MNAKTQLRYALVHTSCKSGIFQMVTMFLCIAFKHLSKRIPESGSPGPITVQYSVKCSRDITWGQAYSFSLLYYNDGRQVYSIAGKVLTWLMPQFFLAYRHVAPLPTQFVLNPIGLHLIWLSEIYYFTCTIEQGILTAGISTRCTWSAGAYTLPCDLD